MVPLGRRAVSDKAEMIETASRVLHGRRGFEEEDDGASV